LTEPLNPRASYLNFGSFFNSRHPTQMGFFSPVFQTFQICSCTRFWDVNPILKLHAKQVCLYYITKYLFWPKIYIDQNWPKLTKIDQNWPKFTKIDKNWQKLTKIDKNGQKIDKMRQKLTKFDQDWLKLTKIDQMIFQIVFHFCLKNRFSQYRIM